MVSASRVISIGRAPESAIVLDDPQVSARHALLYVENGKLFVADVGSTNGVFVNGKRITQAEVTAFDDIRMGECRIKVEVQGTLEAPRTEPAGPPPAERTQTGIKISPQVAESKPPREGTDPAPRRDVTDPAARRTAETSGRHSLTPDLENTNQERPLSEPESPFEQAGIETIPRPQNTAPDAPRARARGEAPEAPKSRSPEPVPPPQTTAPDAPRARTRKPPEPPPTAREEETRIGRTPPPKEPREEEPRGRGKGKAARHQERAPEAPAPRPAAQAPAAPPHQPQARGQAQAAAKMEPAPAPARRSELALMPAPPPGHHEELDEEEEEDHNHVPSFSILDNVVRDRMQDGVRGESQPALEVIRYRHGRLLDVARLEPGDSYSVFDPEKSALRRLVKVRGDRRARLIFTKEDDGNVVIGGRAAALADMASKEHVFSRRKGLFAADLAEGDYAQVKVPGGGYLLRFVRSPVPPPSKVSFAVSKEDRAYGLAGAIGIALMFGGIVLHSFLAPPELIVQDEKAEFAEVSLKDLDMEKPPEPPPPPPPPPEVKPPEPVPPAAPEPTPKPTPSPHKTKTAATPKPPPPTNAPPPPPSAADKALAALENLGPPTSAPKLSTAVSNIAAVRVPAGAPSTFAVAGAIGKLPGNEVLVSTGGRAGGRDTRAAAALLAGKNVGALQGGGGSGKIRGRVDKPPARAIGTAGGTLDRNEILKVLSAAFGSINSCYERQLMKDGSLEGKLVVDWVIDPGGNVSSTRVRSSSIKSEEVASCVSGVIRGLHFPKPTGGSVTVTFPFAFRSASF